MSFTSHARRLAFVPLTLRTLAAQTILPDFAVLNLPKDCAEDFNPAGLLGLPFEVEVNWVQDLGPATKLIPTLSRHPERAIVTIDDDVCYRSSLLEELYTAHLSFPGHIIGSTARMLPPGSTPWRVPYFLWPRLDPRTAHVSSKAIPLGAEGILYPPGSLADGVCNADQLLLNAATCDDLWFWAHGNIASAGTVILPGRPSSPRRQGSSESGLWRTNKWGANNQALRNLAGIAGAVRLNDESKASYGAQIAVLVFQETIGQALRKRQFRDCSN